MDFMRLMRKEEVVLVTEVKNNYVTVCDDETCTIILMEKIDGKPYKFNQLVSYHDGNVRRYRINKHYDHSKRIIGKSSDEEKSLLFEKHLHENLFYYRSSCFKRYASERMRFESTPKSEYLRNYFNNLSNDLSGSMIPMYERILTHFYGYDILRPETLIPAFEKMGTEFECFWMDFHTNSSSSQIDEVYEKLEKKYGVKFE